MSRSAIDTTATCNCLSDEMELTASLALVAVDRNGRVVQATPAAHDLLGGCDRPLAGRRLADVEHKLITGELLSRIKHVHATGKAERWFAAGEQGPRYVVSVTPAEPKVAGVCVATFVPLPEEPTRRVSAAEQRFQSLVQDSPVPAWIKDPSGRYSYVNDAFMRLLELDEPVIGKTDAEFLIHRPDALRLLTEADEDVRSRAQLTSTVGVVQDGGETPTTWRLIRFTTGDDQRSIGGIAIDVTAEHEVFVQLHAMNRRLRSKNQELDRFAHVASHDLQTPLRTIIGFSEHIAAALGETSDPTVQTHLNRIVRAAHRMNELIDSLLVFARVNRAPLVLTEVALDQTLDQVLDDLSTEIRDVGARITRTELPTMRVDQMQVRRLLHNLVSNALKYARPGRPLEVQIGAERQQDQWVFSVQDNGQGIAAEKLKQIFKPFHRIGMREVPGSGLGLPICGRVVQRHGGRLWVESDPGRGSCFRFTLQGAPECEAADA